MSKTKSNNNHEEDKNDTKRRRRFESVKEDELSNVTNKNKTKSTKANDDNEEKVSNRTRVVVTGFGPFRGVPINPSMVLIQELKDHLDQTYPDFSESIELEVREIETSALAAKRHILDLSTRLLDTRKRIIFLHLGVNYIGTGFQLEKCAYNDASFRIPDEQGAQFNKEKVVDPFPFGLRVDTFMDVEAMVDHQTHHYPSVKTKLSTDPGRFVCNYLYCNSLTQLTQDNGESEIQRKTNDALAPKNFEYTRECLFVHIPPFAVVSKEIQLEYISILMQKMVSLPIVKVKDPYPNYDVETDQETAPIPVFTKL